MASSAVKKKKPTPLSYAGDYCIWCNIDSSEDLLKLIKSQQTGGEIKCEDVELEPGILSMADLMHQVQIHHVFPDSKEFVDMHMKVDPGIILNEWEKLDKQNLNKDILLDFVM
jgi:hypothetical protein